MTVTYSSLHPARQRVWGTSPYSVFLMHDMRLSVHCLVYSTTVYWTTMKMLMRKLESWSLGKALLARMAIISLQVNVKTPFHLLSSYFRAFIHYYLKSLTNFENGVGGQEGFVGGAAPYPPAGYGPAFHYITVYDNSFIILIPLWSSDFSPFNQHLRECIKISPVSTNTKFQFTQAILFISKFK